MNDSVWSPLNLDFLSRRLGFAIPEAKAGPPRWTRDGGKTWQPMTIAAGPFTQPR
jgi:hypothetical protein